MVGIHSRLPHRPYRLTAAVAAFRSHSIDWAKGHLVVKYVGREMLIEGDPGEKPWQAESQWV